MLAAVYEGPDQLSLKTVPDPQVTDDSAVLRVESVAVCGSDLRILHHGNPRVVPPAVIGHEIAGVVVASGKNVTRV